MTRRRQKRDSVLLEKGSTEHERLFQAFMNRRATVGPGEASGTARVARAEVFSVQHAGTETLFDLHVLASRAGREGGQGTAE